MNNQSATTAGTASVTATYGSAMPAIKIPTRTNFTFGGYYSGTSGSGTQYYTASGTSARTWDKTVSSATLYAKWTANSIPDSYDTDYKKYTEPDSTDSAYNGGKGANTTTSEVKWMQASLNYCIKYKGLSAAYLTVDGNFGSASAATTKKFQSKYGLTADGSFGPGTIAKMKEVLGLQTAAKTTKITLNNQIATTAGTASVTATYGSAMPAIAVPKKTGYTFGGYYTSTGGSGTQYYNAYGKSVRAWDKTASTATLYAKWTGNTYKVTLNNQSATTAGTTSVTATYGSAMPAITVPKKTGFTFGGYYTEKNGNGTQYYTSIGWSMWVWDKPAATTLYAKWTEKDDRNTEDNPYVLTDGVKKSVTATSVWFECSTGGATDFLVTANSSKAKITVYKKNLIGTGKKELYSKTGTKLDWTLSDCAKCNGFNTYLVNVSQTSSGQIACTVTTHVDKLKNSKGALWVAKENSPRADMSLDYPIYWYVDNEHVGLIRNLIENSDISKMIEIQEDIDRGAISAYLTAAGIVADNVIVDRLIAVAGVLRDFKSVQNFRQDCLDDLNSVAGYLGTDEKGRYLYSKGCVIFEYRDNNSARVHYYVQPWSGNNMTGLEGWVGDWTINK